MDTNISLPENREYSKNMGHLTSMLNKRHKRFMAEHLREYEISGPMYKFLLALSRHPGARQDYLVELFFMDKGNVARIAKKLENLGYIRRETDPDDRRQYMLSLTESGEALLPVIRDLLHKWSQLLTSGFTNDEIALTHTLVEKMLENARNHL